MRTVLYHAALLFFGVLALKIFKSCPSDDLKFVVGSLWGVVVSNVVAMWWEGAKNRTELK